MAGHSKWKNIQHRKGRQDELRSKEFAKLAREIYIVAKSGGTDTSINAALRLSIDKAKTKSMPKENIQRALDKADGNQAGVDYLEVVYEGYGPSGVAILIYCLTDNRNRTAPSVRSIFSKKGGNLGTEGSVSYLFNRQGNILIEEDKLQNISYEDFALEVMNLDIDDIENEDNIIQISVDQKNFEEVKQKLDQSNFISEYLEAEITMVPTMKIELDDEAQENILTLIDQLNDDDDVQNVYHNMA